MLSAHIHTLPVLSPIRRLSVAPAESIVEADMIYLYDTKIKKNYTSGILRNSTFCNYVKKTEAFSIFH